MSSLQRKPKANSTFLSPAKINHFFRILRKRDDGYHEIATRMQVINLCDHISITPSPVDNFSANVPLPWDSSNLIYQALDLFRKYHRSHQSFTIQLIKNIPIGAGLGGGSSNAATTLWALNQYFKTPFTNAELMAMSAKLGSDVPFFFSTGEALCEGRGEKVTSLPNKPFEACLVCPPISVKTPVVFKAVTFQKKTVVNDLEPAAFTAYPKLQLVKEELVKAFPQGVFLTGSGSSYICLGKPLFINKDFKHFYFHSIDRKTIDWY
jgi:4-diphosphocytidyl-2-C-methyl-D-erythritol kinase